MHGAFQQVLSFYEKFHKPIGDPADPKFRDVAFRMKLIEEEWEELQEAVEAGDLVKAWDALIDMQYVINGAGVCWGLDMGFGFDEVHASNMTKTAENKRADGKVQKGPNYKPPQLAELLKSIQAEFAATAPEDRPELLGWPKPSEPSTRSFEDELAEWKAWKARTKIEVKAENPDKWVADIVKAIEAKTASQGEPNTGWRPEPEPPEGVKVPLKPEEKLPSPANDFIRDRFERVV